MSQPVPFIWQQVHWRTPLDSKHAVGLLRRLASDSARQPVIFETRAVEGKVVHLVGTTPPHGGAIVETITAMVPGTVIAPIALARASVSVMARAKLRRPTLPLDSERATQTTRAILAALTSARFRSEEAVLQIVFGRGVPPLMSPKRQPDPTQSWFSLLTHGIEAASGEVAKRLHEKDQEAGFRASIRVSVFAQSEGRRVTLMRAILAALRTVQTPGTRIDFVKDTSALDLLPRRGWLPLTISEVLGLMGWPLDAENLPGMPEPHPKLLRLTAPDIDTSRVFARTTAPGEVQPVGIGIQDALHHTVVLGPTGVGKSTTLLNLIVADLIAGRSVVVIDPKKDLVSDLLERIPNKRADDVVVLDPTQPNPVGINPLTAPGTSPDLVADSLLGVFRDLFPSAFGPRTSDVLHASLLTLARQPDATLVWLPRLLTDRQFRRGLTQGLNDPDGLDSFWDQYDTMSERQQAQFIGPVLSRLRQFLLRPTLKRVLDQSRPRFALKDVFTTPRVLLVPLNTGLLGSEAARLLGSLLVSQLWQLTLARAGQPKSSRSPVSIYIDEAQEFLHFGSDLADALALSRSLGVGWHLAHQYRAQMSPEVRVAIDANARNKIVFTLGIEDAKAMAAMTHDLTPEDFTSLPQHGMYAHLMRRGRPLGWVSAHALPAQP